MQKPTKIEILEFDFSDLEKMCLKNKKKDKCSFEDIKNAIINYFSTKESLNLVASKFNMCGGNLRAYIIKCGLKPRLNSDHKYSQDNVDKLCELYLKGFRTKELAIMFNITTRTVPVWLKSKGIKPLILSEIFGVTEDLKKEVLRLYVDEKLNCLQISKIINISARSILSWVKDVRRSQSEIMSLVVAKNGSVNVKAKKGVLNTRFGSIYFNSSYEEDRLLQLELNKKVVMVKRCEDLIEYELEGKIKRYNPDLLVIYKNGKQVVEEIKPFVMINKINNRLKIDAAKKYYKCIGIKYKVITEIVIYEKRASEL
jgi:transposase